MEAADSEPSALRLYRKFSLRKGPTLRSEVSTGAGLPPLTHTSLPEEACVGQSGPYPLSHHISAGGVSKQRSSVDITSHKCVLPLSEFLICLLTDWKCCPSRFVLGLVKVVWLGGRDGLALQQTQRGCSFPFTEGFTLCSSEYVQQQVTAKPAVIDLASEGVCDLR